MKERESYGYTEVSDQLIHQLYQTTRALSKSLNHLLEEYGLFSSEWTIIKILKEQGVMPQNALANYLNIEPAAISKSLSKLEEKGIVERKAGLDKREKSVFLSPTAIEKYAEWSQAVANHRKKMLDNLPEKNQKEVTLLLQTIYVNAQRKIV